MQLGLIFFSQKTQKKGIFHEQTYVSTSGVEFESLSQKLQEKLNKFTDQGV